MKHNVLVTGASGQVGAEVARLLAAQGHSVKSMTSKKAGPGQVQANLLTGEGVSAAIKGNERLFLMAPPGYTNQDEILIPVIEEAKKQGVKKIVLMTAIGVNASEEGAFRQVEKALIQSGLAYNIIRPNWFFQNFHTFWIGDILEQGTIRLPAENGRVSFIDSRDIAAVAAKLLASDEFNNQEFDLTGPEAHDHATVAQAISEISGRHVGYQSVSPEEFKKSAMKQGVPAEYADFLNFIFGFIRLGYVQHATDSVEKLTGRKPRGLAQYVADYKKAWANS